MRRLVALSAIALAGCSLLLDTAGLGGEEDPALGALRNARAKRKKKV